MTAGGVFTQLKIGSCLAHPDPASIPQLVPCSGPHTEEITRTEDLTARFPQVPTQDQVQAVGDELCPAALRAWTGGDEPRYAVDFGAVGWHLVCLATLDTYAPFTGTLKGAASK
ncbi:MAG: septum formation family protein [Pseudonocardiales bacterium]|nr:septum formation family protein [Pseudonocardiales bacterium]